MLTARASSTGVDHELEVLGAVGVGEHEEAVAGAAAVVLDVVLAALRARFDDHAARRRVVGVDAATPRSVIFDPRVITRKRPLRVRPTPT